MSTARSILSGRRPPLSSAGLLAPPIILLSLRPRRIQPRALLLLPSSYLTFHLLLEDLKQILNLLLRRPSVLSVEIALRHLRNLGRAGGNYDDRRAIALGRHVRAWEFVLDKPSRSIALLRPAVSRVAICDFKRKGCVVMIRHCFEICAGAGCCFLCGDARRGRVLRSTSRRFRRRRRSCAASSWALLVRNQQPATPTAPPTHQISRSGSLHRPNTAPSPPRRWARSRRGPTRPPPSPAAGSSPSSPC